MEDKAKLEYQKFVGKKVRLLREQKGWTQEILAQRAGINDKYVYDIEVGKKCMSIWVYRKLAEAFEAEIDLIHL